MDQVAISLKKVLAGIPENDLETSLKHQDGSVTFLLWNFNCLLSDEQTPLGIIAVAQDMTEWKRAEVERVNSLAMAEIARLSARIATETIEGMMDAVLIISPAGVIINCNQGFEESFGWSREVLGDLLADYVVGVEVQKVLEEILLGQPGTNYLKNIDCQIIDRDQNKVPVLINATLLKDQEGNPTKIIIVIRDVTEWKKNEEALKQRNSEISVLYAISSTLAESMDAEDIFARLVNALSKLEMFNGCRVDSLFVMENGRMKLVPHPQHSQEFIELHRDMKIGDCLCGESARLGETIISTDCVKDAKHTMKCHDPDCRGHIVLPLIHMEKVKGVLSIICAPPFEVKENMEKILHTIGSQIGIALDNAALLEKTKALSLADPLTGIANRRHLDMMLENSLARSRRQSKPLSVVMADIDLFKNFNDTKGHLEGDKLLCRVAALIFAEIRETDMVARYGGEEFLIMLPETDRENACLTAERIRRKIAEKTRVTISLGVASYHKGMNKEDLINRLTRLCTGPSRTAETRCNP